MPIVAINLTISNYFSTQPTLCPVPAAIFVSVKFLSHINDTIRKLQSSITHIPYIAAVITTRPRL